MKVRVSATAIDHLLATPEILRLLLNGVTEEQTQWKATPESRSIAELLEGLSQAEGYSFRPRLEGHAEIERDDNGAVSSADAEEAFAHWEEQREDNMGYLQNLDKGKLPGVQALLREWAGHDLSHIQQIAELVRICLYV